MWWDRLTPPPHNEYHNSFFFYNDDVTNRKLSVKIGSTIWERNKNNAKYYVGELDCQKFKLVYLFKLRFHLEYKTVVASYSLRFATNNNFSSPTFNQGELNPWNTLCTISFQQSCTYSLQFKEGIIFEIPSCFTRWSWL